MAHAALLAVFRNFRECSIFAMQIFRTCEGLRLPPTPTLSVAVQIGSAVELHGGGAFRGTQAQAVVPYGTSLPAAELLLLLLLLLWLLVLLLLLLLLLLLMLLLLLLLLFLLLLFVVVVVVAVAVVVLA